MEQYISCSKIIGNKIHQIKWNQGKGLAYGCAELWNHIHQIKSEVITSPSTPSLYSCFSPRPVATLVSFLCLEHPKLVMGQRADPKFIFTP